jgi:hypothetical protein
VATETLAASEVDLDRLAVDTVRVLAMDAIQKAGSGHPGTAMALAPAAYALWTRFLRFDPADPEWFERDRFMLSNGHASVLQYAVLHLTGYPLAVRDLKQQRQWGSHTRGTPEYGHTPGVEVTTRPLGQGSAHISTVNIPGSWRSPPSCTALRRTSPGPPELVRSQHRWSAAVVAAGSSCGQAGAGATTQTQEQMCRGSQIETLGWCQSGLPLHRANSTGDPAWTKVTPG